MEASTDTKVHGGRRRAGIGLIALLVAALTPFPSGAADLCLDGGGAGGDWPVFAHDPTATGSQSEESTISPDNVGSLEPSWIFQIDGTVESEAVASGGCVFIGSQSGDIYAIEIESGQLAWRADVPSATTLSIANGRVFVQSASMISALDQATGDLLWQQDFAPYSSIGSPLAVDGFVVFGMSGCIDFGSRPAPCRGYYALLDQTDGSIIVDGHDVSPEDEAQGMEGPGFWSHPSYDPEDKYVYFGTANVRSIAPENPYSNALLKIDADPTRETFGEIVGHFRNIPLSDLNDTPVFDQVCAPSPASLAVSVLCIDDDDFPTTAVIFEDSDGNKRLGATHSGSYLPVKTFASFLVPRGNFFGIDPDTMTEVWSVPTSAARAAVSAYDGEKIYFSSGYDGGLIAADKDDGTVAWEANTYGQNIWQHVTAANGVVYTPSGQPAGLASSNAAAMLLAFDAADGSTLLQRPLAADVGQAVTGTVSGGVTIARNTVFIPTNGDASSYLIAYRPAA